MVGSDQVGQRAPDAKSVMLGGGLASLERGRMEVPGQDNCSLAHESFCISPLGAEPDEEGERVKGDLGGVWGSKSPDTF